MEFKKSRKEQYEEYLERYNGLAYRPMSFQEWEDKLNEAMFGN